MSKIGNLPLVVPAGVTLTVAEQGVTVTGKGGTLTIPLVYGIECKQSKEANTYVITRRNDTKEMKSVHGTSRTLIANAIAGVTKPWEKRLEVVGTGFNVKMQGQDLVFKIGYSHPVIFKSMPGVTYAVDGTTKVIIQGIDKQQVGEVAYKVKMLRKPDAYKGKGIKYEGEKLRIKPGKKAKAAA